MKNLITEKLWKTIDKFKIICGLTRVRTVVFNKRTLTKLIFNLPMIWERQRILNHCSGTLNKFNNPTNLMERRMKDKSLWMINSRTTAITKSFSETCKTLTKSWAKWLTLWMILPILFRLIIRPTIPWWFLIRPGEIHHLGINVDINRKHIQLCPEWVFMQVTHLKD